MVEANVRNMKVDVAIIGAGTAGLGALRAARAHTDKVVLIEGGAHGTTCARVGCMPSKLLIAAAEAAHGIGKAPGFGVFTESGARIDGEAVMKRVREERDRFVGFVLESVEEIPAEMKLQGYARFDGPNRLIVGDEVVVEADRIVLATGSKPMIPKPFQDLGDRLIVNDDVFNWQTLPESVAVFGPGVIGLELGQALHRLGVRIRLFGKGGGLGPLTDSMVRERARDIFSAEFPLYTEDVVRTVSRVEDGVSVTFVDKDGSEKVERFDYLLAATGRIPNLAKLDIGKSDIEMDDRGNLIFDPYTMQVGGTHIFIAGDINSDRPLLHEAADEGRIAGDNAGRFPDVRAAQRRSAMSVVFSDPQIAMVGSTFKDLSPGSYAVGQVDFGNQGRSRVILKNQGLLRVYGERGSGRFLGAEMVGPAAEHLAHLLAWSHQQRMTVGKMLEMPFYHPVIEEGLRTALRELCRNLKKGPAPVKNCIDCGPGA